MNLIDDNSSISVDKLKENRHSTKITLLECIKSDILRSPDNNEKLIINKDVLLTYDKKFRYKILSGSPFLYPTKLVKAMRNGDVPLHYTSDSLIQNQLLSQLKAKASSVNAKPSSQAYEKHLFRMNKFCRNLQGKLLDIGCDDTDLSESIYPSNCDYIGLDPVINNSGFRVIGIGEILPFHDLVFDCVTYNTSLDHILDYHTAINEAYRVLKKGGTIVIATYIWNRGDRSTLLSDSVHFHHFREFEILGAIDKIFKVIEIRKYEDPKGDSHRYGFYISAKKI